ncbi:MAG: PAS domain S-box protein [Flavobacterium sp.]|nr:MAG: PAS domain S-box protein [Flavobacterium sp.]
MEYPCDSPTQKRWFVMQAKRFAGDENKVVVAHIDISLRRQAEEKLKASELKFRLLLEQNRDGIALLDETLKPTYVSPAIFEILGYDVDQIQGVDLLSLVHPEDVETIQQVVAQAMATPGVPTKPKVTRMKSRAGEWKYIEGTLNNMLHDPAINAVIDNFRDITPEKLALEKLVKANRFSSISGGIGQILAHAPDEQTLFDDVCEVAVKLGGYLAAAVGLINPETLQLEAKASNGFPDDGDFDVTSYLEPDKLNSILHGHSTFEMFTQSDQPERGQIFDRGMALPLKRHGQAVGVFFVYSNNASHFDADESVLLMQVTSEIAFTIDLLENDRARRKTENELRIQNAKLRQAQKIAKLGTWEVDLENAVATWSVELLNMYGFPPEQANISYRDWLDRVHPDDRANFDLSRERAQNAKTGYSITHRIVRTDGHIRNVVSQLNFELDENGKAVFLIGVTQDITDFQEIMQALRASEKAFMQSESRYRQIVEMANEGICLLNEKNQIVFANSRLSEILGYTSEEFYNENLLSFQYTRNHNIEIAVRRILATQSAGVVELCLRSKNGDPVWANVALSIVADDFGETRGFVALISNITQKREAEQSNKFKAHLLNNISQAVVATNKSGVVKYWNKAAEKLYKRDASDVIGLRFKEVVDPSRMEMASEMWESSKKGNDWSGDIEMKNERGQSLAYQVTSQPIYDQREKYDGMLAVTTDVTEQRTLERLLEWSARLAKLGHFEIDVVNNTLIRSKLTMEILRATHSVEPDVANALGSYKPGVSRDTVLNAYQDALKYGKDWDFEAQLDTDDESEIWVRLIGKVEMVNGQTVRIFGSVQDITAQKLSEKAVLNAFQERDLIFESIGDAFFAVDQNWSLNYLNGKAESVLLKKREDILGKNLWEVFPEYVGTETFHHYHKAMETQTSVEFDEFFFSFQKWLEVSVFPSPLGLSIYFKDVTERKLAELQMVELNENLQEYTNDLVAANRELRQFSYIVSHNLRGPVTNIIGLARELGDNSYDAETQALFVKSLKSSAERLDNVITDLNDVLQLKSGGVEMKEKIELSTAVDVVIKTIQNQIASESGRVDTDFSSVDEIVTVKSYLHSIIHNLVLNAVKYRKPDVPPVIRITSAETRDGIELQISDNGLGMDLTRTKNDLFGMYKRFHFHVEGKGIGLFMVKTQIEILGGTISVDSALGQGTTFRLFFPR